MRWFTHLSAFNVASSTHRLFLRIVFTLYRDTMKLIFLLTLIITRNGADLARFRFASSRSYRRSIGPSSQSGKQACRLTLRPCIPRDFRKIFDVFLSSVCSFQGAILLYRNRFRGNYLVKSGSRLLSHTVSSIVPSAAYGLTIVFGMGTGVSHKRITTGTYPALGS